MKFMVDGRWGHLTMLSGLTRLWPYDGVAFGASQIKPFKGLKREPSNPCIIRVYAYTSIYIYIHIVSSGVPRLPAFDRGPCSRRQQYINGCCKRGEFSPAARVSWLLYGLEGL